MFKSKYLFKSWLLAIFITAITQIAFASPITNATIMVQPSNTVFTTTTQDINIIVSFVSDEENPTGELILDGITSTAYQTLNVQRNSTGNNYTAIWKGKPQAGSLNYKNAPNASIKVNLYNGSGKKELTETISVDNKMPEADGILSVSIKRNGTVITGNSVQAGDVITFSQKVVDDDIASVKIGLTALGESSTLSLVEQSGTKTWTGTYTVVSTTPTGGVVPVYITDIANQTTTNSNYSINVGETDTTTAPVINQTSISLTSTSGHTIYITDDIVSVQFDVTSEAPLTGEITYNTISTPLTFTANPPNTYKAVGDFRILPGNTNYTGAADNGEITITVRNSKGTDTAKPKFSLDNKRPSPNGNMTLISIVRDGNPITGDLSVVKPGDTIKVQQKTTDDDTDTITMDLTAFGLQNNVPMTGSGNTFEGTFTIPASANTSNFTIGITIKDKSGQETPIPNALSVSVDSSKPPEIDEGSITLTPANNTATPYKTNDTVTVYFEFISNIEPTLGRIKYNTAQTPLQFQKLTGDRYSATGQFVIIPGTTNFDGTANNSKITLTVFNNNSSDLADYNITIDDKAPSKNGNMSIVSITRNSETLTGGLNLVKPGDVVKVKQKVTDADSQTVTMDLSSFGLSSVEPMTDTGDGLTFEGTFTVPDPLTGTNFGIGLSITDKAGQTTSYENVLTVTGMNNGAFATALVKSNAGDGNPSKPGNQLTFTAIINNFDSHIVTVECDELKNNHGSHASVFNSFPYTLELQDRDTNNTATLFTTITLPTDQDCYYNGLNFKFVLREKTTLSFVTRATRTVSFNDIIDLGNFQHRNSTVEVYTESGDLATPQIATCTSTLKFISDVTATAGEGASDTVTVTVDLTPIGESPLVLTYNPTTNKYEGTYNGGFGNIQLDGKYVSFTVTAVDRYGKELSKTTTPAILIDNVLPVINTFTITGATGTNGIYKYKDILNITADITGANASGMAFIDLTNLDDTGVNNLRYSSGTNWTLKHTIGLGEVDGDFDFVLVARDAYGNETSSTVTLNVDNAPPIYKGKEEINETEMNPPYVIIGDQVTTRLHIENYNDELTIKVDLSGLDGDEYYGIQDMVDEGSGNYSLSFTIATGTINHGATFPIIIYDNAGNTLIDDTVGNPFNASFTFPLLDQNPPDPGDPTIQIVNMDPSTPDELPNTINSWKKVTFTLPYTRELGYDDSATTSVDITNLNKPNDISYLDPSGLPYDVQLLSPGQTSELASMTKTVGRYTVTILATESPEIPPINDYYEFDIVMSDISGNKVAKKVPQVDKIDLVPPIITSVEVTGATGLGGIFIVDDTMTINVRVEGNENKTPYITGLTNISNSSDLLERQFMDFVSPGYYTYSVKITEGNMNNVNASWTIRVYDNANNFDEVYTPEVKVDNKPLDTNAFTVTSTSITNNNRINYSDRDQIKFTIDVSEEVGLIKLDLSAIGHNTPVTEADFVKESDFVYSYTVVPEPTNASYTDYSFIIHVLDENGNLGIARSNVIQTVDCQLPEFVSDNSEISARSSSLPAPTDLSIARTGDTITISASITAYIDATAEVELEINPGIASTTAQMTYNSAKNRHEANFVIEPSGVNGWSEINSKLNYILKATDMAQNIATPSYGLTNNVIENYAPKLVGFTLTIDPDIPAETVLSIGSGTVIEYLIASASLQDNREIKSATLDFSGLQGAPSDFELASITKNVANSRIGEIDLTGYPTNDFYDRPLTVTINVTDTAGFTIASTTKIFIDTKPIELAGAYFDGKELLIDFSEASKENSFIAGQWEIIGSTTEGLTESINLGDSSLIDDVLSTSTGLTITLTAEGQRKFVNWPDSPIYLRATNTPTSAAVLDRASNWIEDVDAYPIVITDHTLREDPAIASFEMEHNWPTNITFTVHFTQEMDKTTFVASQGVLFVDPLPGVTSFNDVSYDSWYVFQITDEFRWEDNKTLKITLSESGKDWVAANLTADTSKTLKFAQYYGKRMVKSIFDKYLKQYTIPSPVIISDNRGTDLLPPLNAYSSPKPIINLASATITLTFNDKVRLFADNFTTANETDPLLGIPTPTEYNGSTDHINKISLFNLQNNSSISLVCKQIKTDKNEFASTTVHIDLTNDDVEKILNFYNAYDTLSWGLQIEQNAFYNMWEIGNTKYKPTVPGTVVVIEAVPTAPAAVLACSVSDMPPTKEDVENFTFDFELARSKAGVIELPFKTTASPTAYIYESSTGDMIAPAAITKWSTRTVNGQKRTIATFKLSSGFSKRVDGVDAELRIDNLYDVFGNPEPVLVASYVYDISKKSDSTATGYTAASAAFIIDNVNPTVDSIDPVLIGLTSANTEFIKIEFSEKLDTNLKPTVSIATTSSVIRCTFVRWEDDGKTAIYKNNQAVTSSTPNGAWNYKISDCQDQAGNVMIATDIEVTIKTGVPTIENDTLKLYSIRKNIDNNVVVENKPFNFDASPDYIEIGFKYISAATENTPHRANFYNISGTLIGSSTVRQSGINATATLKAEYFTEIPTTNTRIDVKIEDIAGNESDIIGSLNYYAKPPVVTNLTLTGTATNSASIYYYSSNSAESDMQLKATMNNYYGKLNLLLASYSVPLSPIATMTISSFQEGLTLTSDFGKTLPENQYTIYIADEAGNLHTGTDPIFIIVDNTAPTVVTVIPGPDEQVANTAVGMATFTVVFNELMDTTTKPYLSIATSTQRIAMAFTGWGPDGMTASFTNVEPITSTMPAGSYRYLISGAKDMTGNEMYTTPATCTTIIWPAGPGISSLTVYTLQPDINSEVSTNNSYNPIKYSSGYGPDAASVTFKLDYINVPTYDPHNLIIYDNSDNAVKTLPISISGKIGIANWSASSISLLGEGTYYFKVQDSLGNYFPDGSYLNQTFVVDTTYPNITSIQLNDGGIGQTVDGLRYYSPSVPATFTVNTNDTYDLVLLLASDTATDSYVIPATSSYNISIDDKISPSWNDNNIVLYVADLAGNINPTNKASMTIRIDSIPPEVLLATAVDETDSPISLVGKNARFMVSFDSIMNKTIQPIVRLATDTNLGTTEIATMSFVAWLDDSTCVYTTNGVFDTINYPAGTSTIVVSEARDLAGNLVAEQPYGIVEVISKSPQYYATLTSQQTMISNAELTNKPFSFNAEPGVATISILYNKGPYALDHTLLVFDNNNNQIATHTLVDGATSISVDSMFFGTMDVTNYVGSFTIKLRDATGNISDSAETAADVPFILNYDGITPNITSINFTGISSASTSLTYYYNPDISGNLTGNVVITNNDVCKLIVYGVSSSPYEIIATRSYDMVLTNAQTYGYTGNLNDIYNQPLPEGTYKIQVADNAGNIPAQYKDLLIDKTAPEVLVATISNELYISSGDAGMATFTIQFNESLFENAYQYLEIATTSYKIPCRFVEVFTTDIASDTAVFETAIAVPSTILQGNYVYHVVGTDLAGNQSVSDFGSIFVKSAGPVVSSIKTFSYQATTASDTLISGNEYHYDDMFSFNVEPYAATMTIKLSEAPDGDPDKIYLTFAKEISEYGTKKEVIVASHTLALSNLTATFTWDTSTLPAVATEAQYIIRVADANHDLSAYSYKWIADCVPPTYSSINFQGGVDVPASGTVYINPYRHTDFSVIFKGLDDHSPKLRVRSEVSTDTYALESLGSNSWKTIFRGKYSRLPESSEILMPDGIYSVGLVDQAGNEASSGTVDLYQLIIDTKSPVISTFTLTLNGIPVGETCSPNSEKPLVITLETTEAFTATGPCFLDVYNAGQVRVARLPIVESGSNLEAKWYGTDSTGSVVADGKYTFKASDFCGNVSDNSISITAITAPFEVMNPAVQISSDTIKLWFNHGIDVLSLTPTTITSTPALTISNVTVSDERALLFNVANMSHGASYTLIIESSLRNIYGSTIGINQASFIADAKGPSIVETSFDLVNSQNEIMVIFDQTVNRESAEKTTNYQISDASGNPVPISQVILQADNSSVMIYVTEPFVENANYIVKAGGVTDELGNKACESAVSGFTFKGRDITPPTFKISAFSNAANENDIIVVVVSNEELIRVPTLTIKHGNSTPIDVAMQKSSINKLAFMAAASLKSYNGQTGILKVTGEDLNGNKGSGEDSFVIATVSTKSSLRLASADKRFSLTFDKDSLKADATVKILQRIIEKDETASGTLIQTALQNEYSSMRGARASITTQAETETNSELTPLTGAYEAALPSKKINKGAIATLKVPDTASSTSHGIGLFYQKNGTWNFISANRTAANEIKARITSTQIFAIMQDSVSPSIKLDDSMNLSKAFETARPEFLGSVKDFGSGVNPESVEVKIDSNTQPIKLNSDGTFKFKPLSELTNGSHELSIRASDRTGNISTTESMRFELVLPFEFKQIIQYPNPAKNYTNIRIRTNSTGIDCGIKVKIFDVAGHKVAEFDEADVIDKHDGNYEIRWDLTNLKNKKVANGTYLAKIEATNPENGKKIKKTLKIAVLR